MTAEPPRAQRSFRLPRYTGTAVIAGMVLAAVGLLASAMGLNVVHVFLALAVLFIFERTLGDWLSELVGPTMRRIIVGGLVCLVGWQLLAADGRLRSVSEFLGLDQNWIVEVPTGGARVPPSATGPAPVPGTARTGSTSVARTPSAPAVSSRAQGPESDSGSWNPKVRVRSVASSTGVRVEASVSGSQSLDGIVEFIVNGKHVATGRVNASGRVEANLPDPGPGTHNVVVRFRKKDGTSEVSAATTLVR